MAKPMRERSQIIASTEKDTLAAPKTLRTAGIERILRRTILQWSDHFGSYGTGGPGFFGFKLEATQHYPEENLILTLWGAANWLLFDGRWLETNHDPFRDPFLVLNDCVGHRRFSELVIGAFVEDALFEDQACKLSLRKGQNM